MRRIAIYDHENNYVGEVNDLEALEVTMREEINGEHSLEITTTQTLEKGQRLRVLDVYARRYDGLILDCEREYVVAGVDEMHSNGSNTVKTYHCPWSLQVDLLGMPVSVMPGVQSAVSATTAFNLMFSGQTRWRATAWYLDTTGGASMYDTNLWDALSTFINTWGGEVDAMFADVSTGRFREVIVQDYIGRATVVKRFDFGADIAGVKRVLPDTPYYCRISPRGKGEQVGDGYGRKITIEDVNDGKDYLTYSPMVSVARLYNSADGTYVYPTLKVENGDCETPAELKTWAQSVLADYCTPKVTYEVDVLNVNDDEFKLSDLVLGDTVQVVDRYFGDEGLRLEGRIISKTTDLLNERDVQVTIGAIQETISSKFKSMASAAQTVSEIAPYKAGNTETISMNTAGFVSNSGHSIGFVIPLGRAVEPGVKTTLTNLKIIGRQNGQYTYGSSSSAGVSPSSIHYCTAYGGYVSCYVYMSSTTNVTNNDAIGLHITGTLTFSS